MRSRSMPSALVLSLALVPWSIPAVAQQPARPPACTSAEHRQFDFWIGNWVRSPCPTASTRGPTGSSRS